jgi:predicted SAM-dependent methyltransferase
MKVNLGSGFKRIDGFVNVDDDPLVEPDYIVNLEKDKLPFENDSVDEMVAHHVLEHIGEGYIPLMQEIYRVCKHGAIIDVRVPHHFHEIFINDPTHKRPITVEGMRLFSKKHMAEHIKTMGSSTGMAFKFNVDFEIAWYGYTYDHFYHEMMKDFETRKEKGETTPQEEWAYMRLFREANNVAMETLMKLVVIKDDTTFEI